MPANPAASQAGVSLAMQDGLPMAIPAAGMATNAPTTQQVFVVPTNAQVQGVPGQYPGAAQPQVVVVASQPYVGHGYPGQQYPGQMHPGQPDPHSSPYGMYMPLPYEGREGNWNTEFCDPKACCACNATWWSVICCGCFAIGQMCEKLRLSGHPTQLGYNSFVTMFFCLVILDIILGGFGIQTRLAGILGFAALISLRRRVRDVYGIEGGCCTDCLASFFCSPCTILQLVFQMWRNPERNPGCDMGPTQARIV